MSWNYSLVPPDTISILKKNYEDLFALDYINVSFANDISEGWVKEFNQYYFESLAIVYNYCLTTGDSTSANYYLELAKKIANDTDSFEKYDLYFLRE